jgi:hypothetical protein
MGRFQYNNIAHIKLSNIKQWMCGLNPLLVNSYFNMSGAEREKQEIQALEASASAPNSFDSGIRSTPKDTAKAVAPGSDLRWSRIRAKHQNFFSEFFGVFILILFGNGSVAQVVLSKGGNGAYQSITWGWG